MGWALFDHAAEIHHADAIGVVGSRRQIVGDHQDAKAALAQLVEQAEDAGAHGDIEHRDRLVREQHGWLEHERGGDRNALALAARQLVWVAIDVQLRWRQSGTLEGGSDTLFAIVGHTMDLQRLDDGVTNPEARIERLVRILEDQLHLVTNRAHLALREGRDVAAAVGNCPGRHLRHPHDRLRRGCLATTRLADESNKLTWGDGQRNAIDSMNDALAPSRVVDDEIVNLEQWLGHTVSLMWQYARWPSTPVRNGGVSFAQTVRAESQRGWNGQPTIAWSRRGGAPGIEHTACSASRSGVAENSMRVYGCRGSW